LDGLGHDLQVLVDVDEVGMEHAHLKVLNTVCTL
jgi:hypothetical protein